MKDDILERRSFADVDVETTAHLVYETYEEAPSWTDFRYGEKRAIVLRNQQTGGLERLRYQLSGAVKYAHHEGYQWYWGDVESSDHHCALVFNFDTTGQITKITASFCGPSPSHEEFMRMARAARFPAEITAFGCFGIKREP